MDVPRCRAAARVRPRRGELSLRQLEVRTDGVQTDSQVCVRILTLALAASTDQAASEASERDKTMDNELTIRIGYEAFAPTLSDNATAV